ncbi:MAG: alpha/beta hydrolase [Proteobacteria bacterium]|nr:alpha/beta hydrolase [Pseudomonadota bacterium]
MDTAADAAAPATYRVQRPARSEFVAVRGLRHHVLRWDADADTVPLVMLHGWMDVAASFQFVVDALHALEGPRRSVIALDWRGFGLTETPAADCYWFPDYLGDLEGVLDALFPERPVDLLGHSMGGNVAMAYAGVRPARIRRLVNLEGFGMPQTRPQQAPQRYAQWLDELKEPARLLPYDSLDAVAARLMRTNPLLRPERAAWLAGHWAERRADGQCAIRADPAHKRVNPVLYQKDEMLECWRRIAVPLLWIEGDRTELARWWGTRYTREEFETRLAVVRDVERHVLSPAGHMLHHDQPEALARHLKAFLDAS